LVLCQAVRAGRVPDLGPRDIAAVATGSTDDVRVEIHAPADADQPGRDRTLALSGWGADRLAGLRRPVVWGVCRPGRDVAATAAYRSTELPLRGLNVGSEQRRRQGAKKEGIGGTACACSCLAFFASSL